MEIKKSSFGRLSIGEDVNTNRNRIPLESELLTLRNLMAQNTRMSVDLQDEIRSAVAGLGKIKAREQKLLTELESTQSELQASMRFIDILENQYNVLQADLGRLKGLAHPIRRCPPDVLILIFKSTAAIEKPNWCQTSITMSHVCRQWRSIALDCPSLWGHINIPMTDSIPRIKSFFKELACRLCTFAPELGFRVSDDKDKGEEFNPEGVITALSRMLKTSDLNQLDSINTLSLKVPPRSIEYLGYLSIQYRKPIKWIKVISNHPSKGATVLELAHFLRQFPAVTRVQIDSVPNITLRGTKIFESITMLQFKDVGTVHSFSSNPKRFRNLIELELGDRSSVEVRPTRI